ncbi:CPBP family intramembrane metalloprotease [Propioniciclava soli]|uniref:CPBP family intramembrane metalloprotease n=1 Tax=Propioniciclava soli TaxID=2775081 RepID=A0ABZ3CB96_9ACTN
MTPSARTQHTSAWGLVPAAAVALAAVFLFAVLDSSTGYLLIVAGLIGAAVTDARRLSDRLLPDLACVAAGLTIISLIPLKADISWPMFFTFGVVLTAAVAVPWWLSHRVFGVDAVRFPWGGWRWSGAQWAYLVGVLTAAYFLLPSYFLSSGVYENWPAITTPSEIGRLLVGVNVVGLWDELFFICTVFALFRRHFPTWQANVLQATIFVSFLWELGYQAWGPLLTVPFALIQGAIFGLTKNLTYVVVLHLLFDVIVFLVILHGHNPAWPHPFPLAPPPA